MAEYTGVCEGRFILEHTYHPEMVNYLTEEGHSKEEILAMENRPVIRVAGSTMIGYYFIYEYEVNGVTYIRATEKRSIRKDRRNAIMERMRYVYRVYYDPENPGRARLGEIISASGDVKADNSAMISLFCGVGAMLTGMFVIPSVILAIISITKGIKALKNNTYQPVYPVIGFILSGSGLLSSLIMIIMILVAVLSYFFG